MLLPHVRNSHTDTNCVESACPHSLPPRSGGTVFSLPAGGKCVWLLRAYVGSTRARKASLSRTRDLV